MGRVNRSPKLRVPLALQNGDLSPQKFKNKNKKKPKKHVNTNCKLPQNHKQKKIHINVLEEIRPS